MHPKYVYKVDDIFKIDLLNFGKINFIIISPVYFDNISSNSFLSLGISSFIALYTNRKSTPP